MAHVAIVLGEDFEDSEFKVPYERIKEAGHDVTVLGVEQGAELHGKKGKVTQAVDATPDQVDPDDFDALVVPGGYSPDHLRTNEMIVQFVRDFATKGRTIAAVCHGPSLLIDAELVDGKRLTSWPSIKKDLYNAGAKWEDREVVEDGNLITSRNPGDLEAFSDAILSRLEPGGP